MRTLNPNTLERVENYITEYQKKNGKSPSYRQIIVVLRARTRR